MTVVNDFLTFIAEKEAELGHMLLLSTNRKSYMGSSATLLDLTLSDIKEFKFKVIHISSVPVPQKGAELGHILLNSLIQDGEFKGILRLEFEGP